MTNERETFEVWAQDNLPADSTKRYKTNPDRYYFVDTDQAWEAWQAAYRQGQIDALEKAALWIGAKTWGEDKEGEIEEELNLMAQELKEGK